MNKRLNIYLLVTLALCLFVTKVSAYNVVDEIVGFMLDKRQDNSTSTTTTSTTTTPSSTTTTTTPITSTTSTTSRTTTPTSTTSRGGGSSSTTGGDDTSTTSIFSTLTTATTTRAVTTVTLTLDGGRLSTSTGFTSETVTQTTGPQTTDTGGSGGGISTSTRNTIIGVVVGVGGVIMIGALAIVAYRLRKRKTSGAGSGYPEDLGVAGSPSTGASSRPQDAFKATLDQYHKPQGTVNPSANF